MDRRGAREHGLPPMGKIGGEGQSVEGPVTSFDSFVLKDGSAHSHFQKNLRQVEGGV